MASISILPFAKWVSGTNQNSVPANDNSLRNQILNGLVISKATAAQPASPAEGDIYILPPTPTGSQWAGFDEDDLVIFMGGTWYAFAPVAGVVVNFDGHQEQYAADSSGGWAALSGSGAADRRAVTALAASGSVAIDVSLGDYFTLALAGNVSGLTFSNLPGAGKGASLMIRITQDATARTVAWPASFKWAAGIASAVSTGSGAVDILAITTFDNGTTWDATLAKAFA